MRFEISRGGSGLTYEIRNIVMIAKKMQQYGMKIIWENIGDPVQKGESIPDWMKEVLIDILREDMSYAYSPTKGVDATRAFLAERTNARGKVQITPDDIIFFNGLGDAIARAYSSIQVDARMIMPEPTYSTHLMAEVLHASFPPNTYRMNPYNNWAPDLRELEHKVRSHRAIVGILIINPTLEGRAHGDDDEGGSFRIQGFFKRLDVHLTFHIRRDQTHLQVLQVSKFLDGVMGLFRDIKYWF